MFYVTRVRLFYLQFVRLMQILRILLRHGTREWVSKSRIGRRFVSRKKFQEIKMRNTHERMRITIEELGPTYIKFGQILADRPDLISERLRNELKKLQSKAKPIDDALAKNLIEHELGARIEDVFAEFDFKCLASASIGQAYKGVLKTGEKVVVKIQRPHIQTKIELDLYLMRYLARKAVQNYPELAAIDVVGVVDEFGQNIIKELDYFNEASNIIRFQEMFKDDARIHVPKVFMEYTTRKILVMEMIEGISPDEIEKMKSAGYDLSKVAEHGADLMLQMILKHGFFHADPHPGNIFVMPGNVVAFIDFGMVGTLRPNHITFLTNFALGFYKSDSRMITQSLLTLTGRRYFKEEADLQFEIEELLKQYSYLPFDKINFAAVLQACVNIMVKYELRIPSSIFLLVKALATVEKFGTNLDPDIALSRLMLPYAKQLVRQKYDPVKMARKLYDTVSDYVTLIQEFPGEISEILYKVKEGRLIHEINLHENKGLSSGIRSIANKIGFFIVLSTCFMCGTALIIWSQYPGLGKFIFAVSTFLTFGALIRMSLGRK